jgi:hypothetical protein
MKVRMAGFETFGEHADREKSDEPYSEAFIRRCREKALEYDKEDKFLRPALLQDLQLCVPLHFRGRVFEGISYFGRR